MKSEAVCETGIGPSGAPPEISVRQISLNPYDLFPTENGWALLQDQSQDDSGSQKSTEQQNNASPDSGVDILGAIADGFDAAFDKIGKESEIAGKGQGAFGAIIDLATAIIYTPGSDTEAELVGSAPYVVIVGSMAQSALILTIPFDAGFSIATNQTVFSGLRKWVEDNVNSAKARIQFVRQEMKALKVN